MANKYDKMQKKHIPCGHYFKWIEHHNEILKKEAKAISDIKDYNKAIKAIKDYIKANKAIKVAMKAMKAKKA